LLNAAFCTGVEYGQEKLPEECRSTVLVLVLMLTEDKVLRTWIAAVVQRMSGGQYLPVACDPELT